MALFPPRQSRWIQLDDNTYYQYHQGRKCFVRLQAPLEDSGSSDADSIPAERIPDWSVAFVVDEETGRDSYTHLKLMNHWIPFTDTDWSEFGAYQRSLQYRHPNASTATAPTERSTAATHFGAATIRPIFQERYRNGNTIKEPFTDVLYNARMEHAAWGAVERSEDIAFDCGEFQTNTNRKFTVRLGLPRVKVAPIQKNLQRRGQPLTRGDLAIIIAEEVRRALAASGERIYLSDGTSIGYNDIVLVDVKCVGQASVQPSLGYYPPIA
ncbi:hypothetical protein C8Q74DRAFT_1222182 [Fomes fomentarius]|nr:hypothetical protein C8Q74DRAFT_1222182 [Fomes fomentarius]